MNKKVLFRADSTPNIGIGHLMRCIALAQYLRNKNYNVKFVRITAEDKWSKFLKRENFGIEILGLSEGELGGIKDVELTIKAIKSFKPQWVVLDNYHFDYIYQKALKRKNVNLICIDDVAETKFCSDILINHGIHAKMLGYDTETYTKRLLGTSYALLREEFLTDRIENLISKLTNNNILVTLGGGKHEEALLKIAKALSGLKGFKVRIMSNQDKKNKELTEVVNNNANIEIRRTTYNIKEHYEWADVAICAGGGTCWELCYYGIVGIVGILNENQRLIADELNRRKIFYSVGWYKNVSADDILSALEGLHSSDKNILQMKYRARKIVDGKGVQRVVEAMSKI